MIDLAYLDSDEFLNEIKNGIYSDNPAYSLPALALGKLARFINDLPNSVVEDVLGSSGVDKRNFASYMKFGVMIDNLRKAVMGRKIDDNLLKKAKQTIGNDDLFKSVIDAKKPLNQKSMYERTKDVMEKLLGIKLSKETALKGDIGFTMGKDFAMFENAFTNGSALSVKMDKLDSLRPDGKKTVYYSYVINSDKGTQVLVQKMEAN